MRAAARAAPLLAVLALAAAGPLPGVAGTNQTTAPRITLTAPTPGAQVTGRVTFSWRVDWHQPPASGTVILVHRIGTDPGLTQNVTTSTYGCPVTDLSRCLSHSPNASYRGRHYWQVSMVGAAEARSATWMFMGVEPRPAFDRSRPRVRTFWGSARRGKRAFFFAQVRDNLGEVRMLTVLIYRGLPVLEGNTPFKRVSWRARQRFHSQRPLSRRMPAGVYKICVTAWDRAGNKGRSCARYRIR
jgi:hypothetical protein